MKFRGRIAACAGVLAMALWTLSCAPRTPAEDDVDTSRPSEFGFQTSVRTSLIEEGRSAYQLYCSGCHGVEGDGNGPAARFLHPRPRNFQKALFKFSSTRAGRLPTDDDLRRTILQGLKGSSMPGWDLLPARTVTALIAYVKTFSPKWEQSAPASVIPLVADPYRGQADTAAAVARGEAVYHGFATCWTCHPSYVPTEKINQYLVMMENPSRDVFRDELEHSEGKPNDEGEMIYPPDFRRDFVRSGSKVEDLYRSIAAGITGTAMPTWVDSMEYRSTAHPDIPLVQPADIWAMAYYVQHLVIERPQRLVPGMFAVRSRPQRILAVGEVPAPVVVPPADLGTGEEFEED